MLSQRPWGISSGSHRMWLWAAFLYLSPQGPPFHGSRCHGVPHNAFLQIHNLLQPLLLEPVHRAQQVALTPGLHFNQASATTQANVCSDSHMGQRLERGKLSGTSSTATLFSQNSTSRVPGVSLGMWLNWYSAYAACVKPWVQTPGSYKPGMVIRVCN